MRRQHTKKKLAARPTECMHNLQQRPVHLLRQVILEPPAMSLVGFEGGKEWNMVLAKVLSHILEKGYSPLLVHRFRCRVVINLFLD